MATTTSTSSTSSTSSSTSSTSTSISSISTSSTSTSYSSTSTSLSTSSTSLSTSSTSSSISSTSRSTSSTSSSSTSSSTSISSTSSSISSTSVSSTSQSSTSSSTSYSSISTSFSSTSSSISSTSASTSSTSFSSTSSSSSTSTTTVPGLAYSYIDSLSTPNTVSSARVQAVSGANPDGSTLNIASSAFGSSITAGNTIIVMLAYDAAAGNCSGVTDSNGNTYTKVQASKRRGCEIWACHNVKGGASNIVTAVLNFVDGVIFCEEWAGIYNNGFDVGGDGTSNTVDPSVATPPTTSSSEVVFAVAINDVNTATYTAGAGYSNLVTRSSNFMYGASESKIISSLGPQIGSFVGGGAAISWDLSVAAFKAQPFNAFTPLNYNNAAGDDGDYFIEYGSEIMVQQYKRTNTNNTDKPTFTWKGRSTYDTRISPIVMQIYNVNSATWETFMVDSTIPADTDYQCSYTQSTNVSNYYDSNNVVAFRIYQKVI